MRRRDASLDGAVIGTAMPVTLQLELLRSKVTLFEPKKEANFNMKTNMLSGTDTTVVDIIPE